MPEMNNEARPSQAKDEQLAEKLYNEQIAEDRQTEIDRLYQDTVQPAAEKYSEFEKLGFTKKKDVDMAFSKIMERMDSKDKQIDQLLTILKKKAARGEYPEGKATIPAQDMTEEERRYNELVKEFGEGVKWYIRPPKKL